MPEKGRKALNEDGSDSATVHEHEATVRKGYENAQNPEPQGDGDPGPDQVTDPSQQKRARPDA